MATGPLASGCTRRLPLWMLIALLARLGGCGGGSPGPGEPQDFFGSLGWTSPEWRWHRSPVAVGIDASLPEGYRPDMRDAVSRAVARWSAAGVVELQMLPEASTQQPDIRVRFRTPPEMWGPGRHGESEGRESADGLVSVETHLSVAVPGPMYPLALHELGHALGMWGHSPYETDIMHGTYRATRTDLTPRDVNTLRRLYSQAP